MSQLDHFSREEPHKPFDEPWHAEVFAVTVHLSERSLFSWAEWTEALGEQISKVKLRRHIDGSNDYYNLWLQALIELISTKGLTDAETILVVQNRWADAYRNTPHGKPVKL
ncbi:MAG: nitrile hydratase accessory protein [Alphaproteobacteria bacterium]|nr:nitrile hydratase accessory protein [Alphaproteobacteria bacterium]